MAIVVAVILAEQFMVTVTGMAVVMVMMIMLGLCW